MLFTDDWYEWLTERGWVFVDLGCADYRYQWISPGGLVFTQIYRNRLCKEVESYIGRNAVMTPYLQERSTCLDCGEYIEDCACAGGSDS